MKLYELIVKRDEALTEVGCRYTIKTQNEASLIHLFDD